MVQEGDSAGNGDAIMSNFLVWPGEHNCRPCHPVKKSLANLIRQSPYDLPYVEDSTHRRWKTRPIMESRGVDGVNFDPAVKHLTLRLSRVTH